MEPDIERLDYIEISIEKRRTKLTKISQETKTAETVTIFKAPETLKLQLSPGDSDAYIPEKVSIGPYHFGYLPLRTMDDHKARALNRILHRTHKQDINEFLDPMLALEPQARKCYEDTITLSKNAFAQMMLLDACFILEIIRGHNIGFDSLGYPPNDPVFTRRGYNNMAGSIIKDLIKIENQIPFFVVEKLFEIQEGVGKSAELVQFAAIMFIKWLTGEKVESSQLSGLNDVKEFLHCLNVFQSSLLIAIGGTLESCFNDLQESSMTRTDHHNEDKQGEFFSSASDLVEYGIIFKKPKSGLRRSLWDIKLKRNGVLEIPRIFINKWFKVAFLNLITFEQQCRRQNHLKPIITEYVTFMDKLINSGADVGHLHHAGIIAHHHRSEAEVANLFNDLGKAAFLDPRVTSHYSGLYRNLNAHCNRWNQWKSELRRTYFGNPWAMASLLAAIVWLLLAFFQTFYTIYPYYWPKD